ncbi:uncharacterized protein PODANS_6_11025 [Podospora anserina S mat+]|uniref:Podospora anserina S mat+ genomic DNA chromosome 6, supercontig 4 n=1 Tax=Podospora anserina (strain S / ATCC MYA-4624 / DSM 980 / FGSC 10383) TaxID=515849 RepID=B2ANJ3_PODAN|nr:uncharacterized protein PODANS_6_11025 [Podospora anserina S mat+]CAP65613.1 unnamed protein product [Podospora anserina S mat+]CDP31607.1 Putative protein of unknown function [Podospora anserina S mat+]
MKEPENCIKGATSSVSILHNHPHHQQLSKHHLACSSVENPSATVSYLTLRLPTINMKFQLLTTAAAFFVATVTAIPAPYDNHGLLPDTDDFENDAGVPAVLEARAQAPATWATNFNFTRDFDFPLDHLFAEIERIPDDILEKGDEVLHQWLIANGDREPETALKRDTDYVDAVEQNLSLFERGELAARASLWKIAKCVAAIVQLLATTAVPAAKLLRIKKYIKALGGAKQAVKLMLGATTKAEKLKAGGEILVNLSAELLGISTVKNNCF